jgi:hypothetical protein
MVGEGIIEIGGEKFKKSKEDIRKLKSILDELRIMHIIDDVIFYLPFAEAERMKEIRNANARVWKVEKDGGVSLENRFCHNGRFEYRELIIPDLFENNFTRLILLDDKEYKFLGDLLYGSGH